ncbi:MAG: SPFH domain-containing protein [Desulfomonile tiedjei]|nr:SPFH domain-containing protein [Desulfomonile tiedjei]
MGIWDLVKGELIEVIEWLDDTGDTLVWRFPDQDHEIKMGAKLTVREGQAAVFVNEGQIADVFTPGLYSLNTQNMPVMTTLRSWKYGFESPFKAEVYFVNTRNFLDLKWGTQNPIMMRDADLGAVRLRAFGTYGIRVTDPGVFLKEIVGTDGEFTTDEIEGQLRSMLVSAFTSMLATAQVAALDLAANYKGIGDKARGAMEPEFQKYGVSLTLFLIENISLPPEVEKMLDTRSQMGIVGDMGRFTQFQTAQAIPEAAKSGGAGEFMGMGAGIAMGQQMAGAMAASLTKAQKEEPAKAAPAEGSGKFCSQCGKPVAADAKFCPECGTALRSGCPKCGKPNEPAAKFCQECGEKMK